MLQKYTDYLSVVLRLAPLSVKVYVEDFTKFDEFVTERSLTFETVTKKDIEVFLAQRESKRKLSPATHIRMLSALTHLYSYLITVGVVLTSPVENIPKPKRFPKNHRVYSRSEIKQLIETPKTTRMCGVRDRAIFELFYATGMRRSELASLRIFDIDFMDKSVYIHQGKGNKERLMPLTEPAVIWINKYLDIRPKFLKDKSAIDSLFLSSYGNSLSAASIYELVKRHARTAGLSNDFSPHTFRHAFATHLLHNGADILVVKELLGHDSMTTTQIYTHIETEQLEKIYREYFPR